MSEKTAIQWCDSTVNPTMGCDGCELWNKIRKSCYAGKLNGRFGATNPGYAPTFEEVTLFPGRMADATNLRDLAGVKRSQKPWLDGLPRLIFVSDMSDALSKAVSFDFLFDEIIRTVGTELGQRHQWLWLTKRPKRMAKLSRWLTTQGYAWPANLWAGTSITTQSTTSRIRYLLKVGDEQTVRFLSVEPQEEPLHLGEWLPQLSWVIQGGGSGSQARPFDMDWATALRRESRMNGVPYFLKQLGTRVIRRGKRIDFDDSHAGAWEEWPKEMRVRKFPTLSLTKSSA